ncbi:Uma2 family endonuclease [Phormidium sp. CCY1219]|uniref:Uma2 family endonuclease n=1 Tax=Phormidium sp. CCY1219 TaxID=2886104 RepID=UPI002D1EA048|nr:Uma2 family endonuclease [Phormidium sp. CCY1219]MEB3829147.1 Uma2 family endonuclease [Phormidium sp. CCY1219]
MSVIPQSPVSELKITWPKLPDDFVLPDDPVENSEHPLLANALRQSLPSGLIESALITSNFALCAAINDRFICKAPDWMYVCPLEPWPHSAPRRSYTPHTEGPVPLIVMEFLSDTYGEEYSMEFQQRIGKWYFYEQVIKVPIYAIFQPQTAHLEVYALESQGYQVQTTNAAGRYWIPGLELELGVWEGTRDNRTGNWLRWWNAQGELLLWPEELAEDERQRADTERQRADTERQRADTERQRAEQLAQRLRELGVDPDS